MNARSTAFLEAALLCSRYADNLHELPNGYDVATECAKMIAEMAYSDVLTYPPGKPVKSKCQESENNFPLDSEPESAI